MTKDTYLLGYGENLKMGPGLLPLDFSVFSARVRLLYNAYDDNYRLLRDADPYEASMLGSE